MWLQADHSDQLCHFDLFSASAHRATKIQSLIFYFSMKRNELTSVDNKLMLRTRGPRTIFSRALLVRVLHLVSKTKSNTLRLHNKHWTDDRITKIAWKGLGIELELLSNSRPANNAKTNFQQHSKRHFKIWQRNIVYKHFQNRYIWNKLIFLLHTTV